MMKGDRNSINGLQKADSIKIQESDPKILAESVKNLANCGMDIIPIPELPSFTHTNDPTDLDLEETDQDNKYPLKYIFKRLIPEEIQDLVFNRLDLNSKKESRLVCKQWKTLVEGTMSFDVLLSDNNIKDVIKFGSSGHKVDSLTTSFFHGNYPTNGFGFSEISKITLLPHQTRSANDGQMFIGISETNLENLLEEFYDIEYLYVHSGAVQHLTCPSFLTDVPLPELKKLEISAGNMDGYGALICCELLKNTFPKLTSIDIGLLVGSDSIFHMPLMYEETYDFIARHGENLTDLSLAFETGIDERTLSEEELSIDVLAMDQHEFPNLEDKLESANKLAYFNFFPSYYESRSRYVLGKKLLLVQTCLVTLEVKNLAEPNIGIWECLPVVYTKCAETLVDVRISSCFCPVPEESKEFSCTSIKNCLRLQCFEIDVCGVMITNIEDLPNQIKCLYLGEKLTADQIEYITNNMRQLQLLTLTQGQSSFDPLTPKVTLDLFRIIIKRISTLRELILKKRSSAFKRIRKVVSYSQGLNIEELNFLQYPIGNSLYTVQIDRNILDVDRL